jgi:hypothetical protein
MHQTINSREVILGPLLFEIQDEKGLCLASDDPHLKFLDRFDSNYGQKPKVIIKFDYSKDIPGLTKTLIQPVLYTHRSGWELRHHDCGGFMGSLPIPAGSEDWQRHVWVQEKIVTIFMLETGRKDSEPFADLVTELIWLALLNWHPGLLLHAASIRINQESFLFSGASGIGKSTLSNLWLKDESVEVWGDESVMLWEESGQLMAGGTPWPGSSGISQWGFAPVGGVMMLAHGKENHLERLSPADGLVQIIQQTFLPHWSERGVEKSTALASRMAEEIAVHTFSFLPDETAISFFTEKINL